MQILALQIFPNELLEPNYKDQDSGEQQFYSEVERRREYFKELETRREFAELDGYSIIHKHPLVGTIEKCLANDPKERYNAKDLLATLDEMVHFNITCLHNLLLCSCMCNYIYN